MAPYYQLICEDLGIPVSPDLLAKYQKANNEKLNELSERIEDAKNNLGETEISDALIAKALYLASIGDKVITFKCIFFVPGYSQI